MTRGFIFLLLLLTATPVTAQKRDYDYGKITEIKGMTKFYVNANAGDREAIIKILNGKHGLQLVDGADDAEFLFAFEQFPSRALAGGMHVATGQLDVYLRKGEKLRAVWVKENSDGHSRRL